MLRSSQTVGAAWANMMNLRRPASTCELRRGLPARRLLMLELRMARQLLG
jgi:hypothetical protein